MILPALILTLGLTACSGKEAAPAYVEPVPEYMPEEELDRTLEEFGEGDYGFVFLSMWSLKTVREDDIDLYYHCDHYLTDHEIADLAEMEAYLEKIAEGMPSLRLLYLGIRPDLLDVGELLASEAYLRVMDAHPELRMILIPAYPSVDYWTGLPEERCEEVLADYEACLNTISAAEKESYFYGASEWLVGSPVLYAEEFCVVEELTYPLQGMMNEKYRYQIKPWNGQSLADELRALVGRYRRGEVNYPDLSGKQVVVFGDSIFGNFLDDTGIARILERQTSAAVHNLAVGGASCAGSGQGSDSFLGQLAKFENEELVDPENQRAGDYAAAREAVQDSDGKDLIFVIEFGLNDYFAGAPLGTAESSDTDTTLGALRTGIESLQADYPKAEILVLAPGLVGAFGNGTEAQSEVGSDLAAYRTGILEVADSCGVRGVDLSAESGVNEDTFTYYVTDDVHYNERGRFLLAGKIGEWIAGMQ